MNKWFVSLMLFFTVTLAHADIRCGAMINDDLHLFSGQYRDVQLAAERLRDRGAEVRIITADTTRYGSMDQFFMNYLPGQCSAWRRSGNVIPNILIIGVDPARHKIGIYPGRQYEGVLTSSVVEQAKREMSPAFKAGHWAEGFVTGADYLGSNMRLATTTPRTSNSNNYTTPVDNTPTQETSHVGLVFLILFILLLVGVVVVLLIKKKNYEDRTYNDPTPDLDRYSSNPDPSTYNSDPKFSRPNPYRSNARPYNTQPVQQTVVHEHYHNNDGFVNGMVMGELLSRPTQPQTVVVAPQAPVYEQPQESFASSASSSRFDDDVVPTSEPVYEAPSNEDFASSASSSDYSASTDSNNNDF